MSLGGLLASLGSLGTSLGSRWAVLEAPWEAPGTLAELLERPSAALGAPWGVPWRSLGDPWGVRERPWDVFRHVSPLFRPTPRKSRTCRAKQHSGQTCEYMEREARCCNTYCLRVGVLWFYFGFREGPGG